LIISSLRLLKQLLEDLEELVVDSPLVLTISLVSVLLLVLVGLLLLLLRRNSKPVSEEDE
jgi:hypothetical protein